MQKDKIAISIDKGILGLLDSKIDGTMLRSRSQAIEYFLKKGLNKESITSVVLLLKGTDQLIALKKFRNKTVLENQIGFFLRYGITNFYLVTQNANKEIREKCIELGVELIEGDAKGNASALLLLKDKIINDFIVMSADTFNDFDLDKMMTKHNAVGKIGIMGLMTREDSNNYGNAILDGDFIVDFQEKTKKISSHIVNAGIYVFKREIFELISGNSLEKDVFPKLAKIKELAGFFTYGEYEHFG